VNLELGYDGKRDRWNGYDVSNHMKVIKGSEGIEKERRAIKVSHIAYRALYFPQV